MDVPGIFGAPFRTWLLRRIKLVLKVRGGLTMLSGGHEVICDHHFLCEKTKVVYHLLFFES